MPDPGNECEFSRREKRQFLSERGWKRDDSQLREFWIRGEVSLPLDDAFEEVTTEEFDKPMTYRGDCIQNLMDFTFAFVDRDVKLRRMIDQAEGSLRKRGA